MDRDIINRHQVLTRITFTFSKIHPFHKNILPKYHHSFSLTHLTHTSHTSSFTPYHYPILTSLPTNPQSVFLPSAKMMGPAAPVNLILVSSIPYLTPGGSNQWGCGCLVLVGPGVLKFCHFSQSRRLTFLIVSVLIVSTGRVAPSSVY